MTKSAVVTQLLESPFNSFLLIFGFTLSNKETMSLGLQSVMSLLIIWSLTNIGGIQERKSWVIPAKCFFSAPLFLYHSTLNHIDLKK